MSMGIRSVFDESTIQCLQKPARHVFFEDLVSVFSAHNLAISKRLALKIRACNSWDQMTPARQVSRVSRPTIFAEIGSQTNRGYYYIDEQNHTLLRFSALGLHAARYSACRNDARYCTLYIEMGKSELLLGRSDTSVHA